VKQDLGAQMLSLSSLGFLFLVSIVIGLAAGLFLDAKLHTRPLCTVVCVLLGIAAGFYHVIKEILSIDVRQGQDKSA
jgi:F0F1-type ATP synthase assembly protein I